MLRSPLSKSLFLVASAFAGFVPKARALETDNYNISPQPLADMGPYLSELAVQGIEDAVARINKKLARRPLSKRASDMDDQINEIADQAAKKILKGGLMPGMDYAKWVEKISKDDDVQRAVGATNLSYKPHPSVHDRSGATAGLLGFGTSSSFAPTVNLYGIELGTDKLGHFYSLGHKMFDAYLSLRGRSEDRVTAETEAMQKVSKTENGIFGSGVSGIASNGDKAANFSGMKFFQNLFEPISSHGREWPALLTRNADGLWTFSEISSQVRREYLSRFISIHLNEAFNPNTFGSERQTRVIEGALKDACPLWQSRYPGRTRADIAKVEESVTTWFGQDYGYKEVPGRMFRLSETCF